MALSSGRGHTGGRLAALEKGPVRGLIIQAWRAGQGGPPHEAGGQTEQQDLPHQDGLTWKRDQA